MSRHPLSEAAFNHRRNRLRKRLRTLALRLREVEAIVALTPEALIRCDHELRLVFANPAAIRLFGLPSEPALGQTLTSLLPEHIADRLLPALQHTLSTGEPRVLPPSSAATVAHQTFDAHIIPEYASDGALLGVLLSAREPSTSVALPDDIAVAMFELLFQHAPLGLQIFDRDGYALRVNEACRAMLGLPSTEYGVGVYNILHDSFAHAIGGAALSRRAYNGEVVRMPELPIDLEDASNQWETDRRRLYQDVVFVPVPNSSGQVDAVVACMLDVTERKLAEAEVQRLHRDLERLVSERTYQLAASVEQLEQEIVERRKIEQALRASEERFRVVWENVRDAMVMTDSEGIITLANPAVEAIYGYSPEQMVGRHFSIVMPVTERERAVETYRTMFATPGLNHVSEEPIVRPDGTRRWVEARSTMLEQDGRHIAILSVIRDTTERKQAEDERLRSERRAQEAQHLERLGVLAGGLAHDFNNILSGILGHAELALLDLPPESSVLSAIESIYGGARRAAELTNQLLAYAGRGRLHIQPIHLNALIHDMTQALRTLTAHPDALRYRLAEPLAPIHADAAQIRHVVLHLLTNAAESLGPAGGTITLSTHLETLDRKALDLLYFGASLPPGPYVRLTVSDTGRGMDGATLDRVFDPFFTTKFAGRGLGLAAVQGIVRSHNGALRVQSAPAQGTTFDIWLPVAGTPVAAPSVGATPPAAQPVPARAGAAVLVIDDEAQVRAVTQQFLERMGYSVRTAVDGTTGLALLQAGIPGLVAVVLDLTMPRMSGDAVARAIQTFRPGTPIVLMSGYSAEEISRQYRDLGVAAFLQKPFTRAALRLALEQALPKPL